MDEREIPQELVDKITSRVARECAVIAFEADTNWDAKNEILTRFGLEPTEDL